MLVLWICKSILNQSQTCRYKTHHSLPPTNQLQIFPPVQTVWPPVTSYPLEKLHIFCLSLFHDSSQHSEMLQWNTQKEHNYRRRQKSARQVDSAVASLEYPRHDYTTMLVFKRNFLKSVFDRRANIIIRGSELLMARPRGWKLSYVLVSPRTSFLCGFMDSIS